MRYLLDLDAAVLVDFSFGDFSCGVANVRGLRSRGLSARRADATLRYAGIHDFIHNGASWADIVRLRDSPEAGIVMGAAFDRSQPDLARRAALRARKRYDPLAPAATTAEAAARLGILADEIIAISGHQAPAEGGT